MKIEQYFYLLAISGIGFLALTYLGAFGLRFVQGLWRSPLEAPLHLGNCLGVGVLLNYFALLCSPSILIASIFLGSLGLCSFIIIHGKNRLNSYLQFPSQKKWVNLSTFFSILITVVYLLNILFLPLEDWDARSIWFYQAKLIFYAKSFPSLMDYLGPQISSLSHPDYPKLIPLLAAQISYCFGIWNDFIPKISLLVPFVLAVIYVEKFTVNLKLPSCTRWGLILPFGAFIWNGYMDAYLAIFFLLSFHFLHEFLMSNDDSNQDSIMASFISLSLCLGLKNEGLICLLVVLISFAGPIKKKIGKKFSLLNLKSLFFLLMLLAPHISWMGFKQIWHLHAAQITFDISFFERVATRLPKILFILKSMILVKYIVPYFVVTLFILLIVFMLVKRRMSIPSILIKWGPYLFGMTLYFGVIFVVYLQTPSPLEWHLDTSLNRTMMPILGLMLSLIAGLWSSLKSEGKM